MLGHSNQVQGGEEKWVEKETCAWVEVCILALGMNSELVTSQGKPEEIAS